MRNKMIAAILIAAIPVTVFAQDMIRGKHRGHANVAENSNMSGSTMSGSNILDDGAADSSDAYANSISTGDATFNSTTNSLDPSPPR